MTFSTHTYDCDSCGLHIPVSSPRVHCLSPACFDNYDLCAICALGERFIHDASGTHLPSHPTQVYKISGTIDGFPRRVGLGVNGASETSVTSTATITYFDRAVGSPTSKSPGRSRLTRRNEPWLTHHHRRSSGCYSIDSVGSTGSMVSIGSAGSLGSTSSFSLMSTHSPATSYSSHSTPSPAPEFKADYIFGQPSQVHTHTLLSSQYDNIHIHGHDDIPPSQTGWTWTSLFMPDMTPSQTFRKLINAVFSSLDRQGTGYLTPEAYSRFLDDLGYESENNIWKSYLRPIHNFAKEDVADQALRAIFDLFSIEYRLATRTLYEADESKAKSKRLATPLIETEDVETAKPDVTALSTQLQALLGSGRGTAFVTAAGQGFAKKVSDSETQNTPRQNRSRLNKIKSSSSSSMSLSASTPTPPTHTRKLTMPLLTREGFASLTCLNVLCDPDAEWVFWNQLLRNPFYQEELVHAFGFGSGRQHAAARRALGPLPRDAFPAHPDLASLKRVQDVFDHAERMRRISGNGSGNGNAIGNGNGNGRFVEYANAQMKERVRMGHNRGYSHEWDVLGDNYNDGVTTLYTTCR